MKTFKFITALVLLASVLVAVCVVLKTTNLFRKKEVIDTPKTRKIKIIGIVYIIVATALVIILMSI